MLPLSYTCRICHPIRTYARSAISFHRTMARSVFTYLQNISQFGDKKLKSIIFVKFKGWCVVHVWFWNVEDLPNVVPKVLDLLYEVEICSVNRCCSTSVICVLAVRKDVYWHVWYFPVICVYQPM